MTKHEGEPREDTEEDKFKRELDEDNSDFIKDFSTEDLRVLVEKAEKEKKAENIFHESRVRVMKDELESRKEQEEKELV